MNDSKDLRFHFPVIIQYLQSTSLISLVRSRSLLRHKRDPHDLRLYVKSVPKKSRVFYITFSGDVTDFCLRSHHKCTEKEYYWKSSTRLVL